MVKSLDSFEIYQNRQIGENKQIPIDEHLITLSFEKNRFKRQNISNPDSIQWIDVTNEHFISWVIISTSQNFKKLWGRINQEIKHGSYKIIIHNCFYKKILIIIFQLIKIFHKVFHLQLLHSYYDYTLLTHQT